MNIEEKIEEKKEEEEKKNSPNIIKLLFKI